VPFAHLHFSWLLFAVLFMAPDLLMFGYLANPRLGAALYNVGHTLIFPLALAVLACGLHWLLLPTAIIWIAHIALDRLLGYGLKYPSRFNDTHLRHIA
jgi:Domain of unknown function (DUF4260)